VGRKKGLEGEYVQVQNDSPQEKGRYVKPLFQVSQQKCKRESVFGWSRRVVESPVGKKGKGKALRLD